MVRLDEYTKDEWRDVARKLNPLLTDEEYEDMWDEYELHMALLGDFVGGVQ